MIRVLLGLLLLTSCGYDHVPGVAELIDDAVAQYHFAKDHTGKKANELRYYLYKRGVCDLRHGDNCNDRDGYQSGDNGESGEQGATGTAGAAGTPGTAGAAGAAGRAGADGSTGADGTAGVDGADGNDGSDGRDGEDGVAGADGADGRNGYNGKDGKDGKRGKSGKDGDDGADGDSCSVASKCVDKYEREITITCDDGSSESWVTKDKECKDKKPKCNKGKKCEDD